MIRLIYIVIISIILVFPFDSEAQTNTESKIEELSVKIDSQIGRASCRERV